MKNKEMTDNKNKNNINLVKQESTSKVQQLSSELIQDHKNHTNLRRQRHV